MTDSLIDAAYWAWIAVAAMIVVHLTPVVWRKAWALTFDRNFWLATGILLAWFSGGVVLRGWFSVWREGGRLGYDTSWMLHSPMIVVGCAGVIAAGLMHIRSFSVREHGERHWLICLGLTGLVFFGHLFGVQSIY